MSKKSKNKYYVVWKGHQTGIFNSWAECQKQIKGFAGAQYKGFPNKAMAEAAFQGLYQDVVQRKAPKPKPSTSGSHAPVWESIAVDAACSGNPGPMEYQGVHTTTGKRIFHQQYALGTNNIGEFLAIVHALALMQKQGDTRPIYTDSRTALAWVRNKKCKSQLLDQLAGTKLATHVNRAEMWLRQHTYPNELLKWDTNYWGEIPADFGRK